MDDSTVNIADFKGIRFTAFREMTAWNVHPMRRRFEDPDRLSVINAQSAYDVRDRESLKNKSSNLDAPTGLDIGVLRGRRAGHAGPSVVKRRAKILRFVNVVNAVLAPEIKNADEVRGTAGCSNNSNDPRDCPPAA